MIPKRRLRVHPVGIVTAVLTLVLAIAVIAPSFGTLMPDTKPEIYLSPGRAFTAYIWPWQDNPGMGSPSFNVGLAPVCALVWGIERLGAEPWLAARLLRLILFLVAGWGTACLIRRLPSAPRWPWAPLVGGVLFVLAPYTLTAGATLPVLLPLATLPWMALFLLRALTEDRPARWAAAFGLAFAAGSGMNAGVVPLLQLLSVPAVVLMAVVAGQTSVRRAGGTVLLCAGWTVLLSLYWVVPTVAATQSGGTVLANTETLDGIFGPSSLAEVVRGLGLWPLYGGDTAGPWQPGFSAYLANRWVLACSFALPALAFALASRAAVAVRAGAVALVVGAALVMAGGFPTTSPGPLARALTWVFETFPATGAFRTTNKVGSLLALGIALLTATGLAALWSQGRTRRKLPALASAALVAVVAVSATPLWTGGIFLGSYDVPQYWRDASGYLKNAPSNERIWLVPGERLANYRWATPSPDDVGRSLFDAPTVVRTTVPNGTREAANLLAAADLSLADPDVTPQAVADYARLLGAGRILVRGDLAQEKTGGEPASGVLARLEAVPGLTLERTFGAPGTNTAPPGLATGTSAKEPPLHLFRVEQPGSEVRTRSLSGAVLLAGDGFGVASLAAAGLLEPQPVLAYLHALTPTQAAAALKDSGRVVLTDSNRRRALDSQRLVSGQGPLVARSDALASTLALGSPEDQTALRVEGGTAVVGGAGSRPVPLAETAPENAFDGNPATSWQFGGFDQTVHQSVTRTFTQQVGLGDVVVRVAALGQRTISRLRVTAGDHARDSAVAPDGTARFDFSGVRASSLTVTVLGTVGSGTNRVGIAEVESGGGNLTRVAELPKTLDRLVASLPEDQKGLLRDAPVDVLLSREKAGPDTSDDEETTLNRDFSLPSKANYFVSAMVRPGPLVSDSDFDRLAGYGDDVTAVGSTRAFGLPTLRGSQALDGSLDTAWVPSSPETGQTLTITSKSPRTLSSVTVEQVGPGGAPADNWVSRAEVVVDGRPVAEGALKPGRSTLRFDKVEGRQLQLRILGLGAAGGTVRISEVEAGGLAMTSRPDRPGCVPVLALDGAVMSMRPVRPLGDLASVPWETCHGEGLPLAEGEHRLRGTPTWSVDSLQLRDSRGLDLAVPSAAPALKLTQSSATRYSIRTGPGSGRYAVVLGQGRSAGWTATMDGRQLPEPATIDGFAMGWVVDDSARAHHIELVYTPRASAIGALLISSVGFALALAMALGLRRRARHEALPAVHRPQDSAGPGETEPGAWRVWGPAILLVLLGLAAGGLTGGVLGVAVAALFTRCVPARLWCLAAAAVMAVVPVLWLWGNGDRFGQVTPDLVSGNLAPHFATLGALLCLAAAALSPADGPSEPEQERQR